MYNKNIMALMRKKGDSNVAYIKGKKISLVVGILLVSWLLISLVANLLSWKAVFLDNGQVYFGRGINVPFTPMLTLRNVYLLRVDSATSSSPLVTSITEQVQAPRDTISISKSHIIYIQDLRGDSPLVEGLERDLDKK